MTIFILCGISTGMIYSLEQDMYMKDAITALQSAVNIPWTNFKASYNNYVHSKPLANQS